MLGQMALFAPESTLPLRRRVSLAIISSAEARYALEHFHYLHRSRTGRQLNYAVLVDGCIDGVITFAYPAGANPILGEPPGRVLEFARLYLARNIPHTASCAIGIALRRIADDWTRRFPEAPKPTLIVSWSDKEYHKGTIYRAANFKWLKESAGAAAGGLRRGHKRWGEQHVTADLGHHKDCWVYRLKNSGD